MRQSQVSQERKSGTDSKGKMDPKIVKEVLDVKLNNRYPEGLTSKERYVIKRRADTFRIKGKDMPRGPQNIYHLSLFNS